MAEVRKISFAELAKHNKEDDAWIAIDHKVYDITKFAKVHPGGRQMILKMAGKDVTEIFKTAHNHTILPKFEKQLMIGEISSMPDTKFKMPGTFGDMVPYGDPIWYQRFNSPYYTDSHKEWRAHVRDFVDRELMPTVDNWVTDDKPPADILLKMGEAGLLGVMAGMPYPEEFVPKHVPRPKNPDYFHELITFDEVARVGYSTAIATLTNGPAIALSAVLRFGTPQQKKMVCEDVLMGRKIMALAISEPFVGSDVAGLQTTAERVPGNGPSGFDYLVNGNKKWMTGGSYADYYVLAVSTGGRGQLSFLLIDREKTPGLSVRKIAIRNADLSGTSYLDFDKSIVPGDMLVGKEGEGFKTIMHNFNHERFYIITVVVRLCRVCIEECVKYASRREAFGKKLMDVQSIRLKLAAMARMTEQLSTWLEYIVYQMQTMGQPKSDEQVGDVMCMLKAQSSKTYEMVARETTMIFGGNALHMNSVARRVEPAVLSVKAYQIPGGAEDVMDDFAGRAIFKRAAMFAKL